MQYGNASCITRPRAEVPQVQPTVESQTWYGQVGNYGCLEWRDSQMYTVYDTGQDRVIFRRSSQRR
jgi:hypothetical protein